MFFPRDFDLTKQFYSSIVGWEIHHEWTGKQSRGVMFNSGSALIELLSSSEYTPESLQGAEISFRVKAVWSLWEELKHKAPVGFPLRQNPWGDDSFCILDPDGRRLTFFTGRADEQVKPII